MITSEVDFGDAPHPPYPTLNAIEILGAAHYLGSDVYLGSCVDAEVNGQPTAAANGDDVNGSSAVYGTCEYGDDEDGVTFATDLIAGQTAAISATANSTCTLSAWIDFNADGDWWDRLEELFPNGQQLAPGENLVFFSVLFGYDSTNLNIKSGSGGNDDIVLFLEGSNSKFRLLDNDNNDLVRIQQNGNVGIGTTSPSFLLEVDGSAGKPGGGSWSDSSDARLKKNIHPIDGRQALDVLNQLQGVSFEWVNPGEHSAGTRARLIAQDVEKVFPDWVEEYEVQGSDAALIPEGGEGQGGPLSSRFQRIRD